MKFSFFLAADVPCQLRLLVVSGYHGEKHIKAQSIKSSKSVVNSVLISREMPVFHGFFEIVERFSKNDYSKTKLCRKINGGLSRLLKLPSNILFQFMTKLFRISFPITVCLNELLAPPIDRSSLAIASGVLENIRLLDAVSM